MGKNYFRKDSAAGFTLIELLIAIAVIGVLAIGIVTLVNPSAQIQKANDSRRKSDLAQIQKALEVYYQDIGTYPPNPTTPRDYRIKGLDGNTVDWGLSWAPYMATLPKDQNSSKKYVYVSTGQAYYLYAALDRESMSLSSVPAGASCGLSLSIDCNYGVSSPNVSP